MMGKVRAFFKDVASELKLVSWASPKELLESTKIVFITVILLSMVIGVLDLLFARLMSWMLR